VRKTVIFVLLLMLCPSMVFAEGIDTKTYLPWNIDSQKTLYVLINSESEISESKKIIINEVIMSEKSVMFNDQNYFEGWQGALDQIPYSDDTPIKLVFTDNEKLPNTIFVNLVDESSKFDGFTKFDLNKNKIVKSHVTIYNSKNLNDIDFEKILCHEFGHGLGLAHSKNINDIMFPFVEQSNPYISHDDLSALSLLYH
jgi:hypothetical protein